MDRERKEKRNNRFTTKMQKKLVVLYLCVLLAFAGLSARLFLINRDNGEQYEKQVLSQQQYSSRTLPYKRGEITDRKGTKLAVSEKVYNVILDCKLMNERRNTWSRPFPLWFPASARTKGKSEATTRTTRIPSIM